MNEAQLMRQHTLFQKSWTGYTSCSHGGSSKPGTMRPITHRSGYHRDSRSKLESGITVTNYTNVNQSNEPTSVINSNNVLPPLQKGRFSPATTAPPRTLHRSVNNRKVKPLQTRPKPWRETPPKLSDNTNKRIELHYSKHVPKQKWLEYKPRQYVSNPKYGSIYEMRKDVTDSKDPVPPTNTWLWEEEYRIWRLDEKRPPPRSFNKRGFSQRRLGKLAVDKPHAELFAAYHSHTLDKQNRQRSAIIIQRHVRGWLVRKKLTDLKRQILRGLSLSWPKFTAEYKETVTRIQSRYGMMKVDCKFDLKQVQDFVDRREKCERVYDKMVGYGKLEKSDLAEFFRQSGLYPTEAEITKAFHTIYRGSLNTAEVVFVLDCSASLGPVNFQNQLNFVKDVILGFDIAPDRVRIGLVPFNENVFHSFGLTQFQTREGVLEAIENLKYKTGLTRTDLALKMMRQIFKSSRPGVQKVALVITDGKSSDAGLTIREARLAREENIEIFTIGVGYTVDADELVAIADDKDHVRTCIDYSTIGQLKDLVKNRICLGSDQAGGKARKGNPGLTDVCRPLTRDEVLEILWTVYPPDGTGLQKRKSTWIRPIVDGVEAWSLLDDKIIKRTDYKKCLRFVIQSKLERDGYMEIPTDLRLGVERVSNLEEALQKVDAYLKMKERQKLEDELRQKAGQPRSGGDQLDSSEQPPIRVQILKIEHHDNGEPTEVTAADLLQYQHKEGGKNVEIITFDDEEARSIRGDGRNSTGDSVLELMVPDQGTGSGKQVLESSHGDVESNELNNGGFDSTEISTAKDPSPQPRNADIVKTSSGDARESGCLTLEQNLDKDSQENPDDISSTDSLEDKHVIEPRNTKVMNESLDSLDIGAEGEVLEEDSIEAAEAEGRAVGDDDTDKSFESSLSNDSLNLIPRGSQSKASQTEQSLKAELEKDRIKYDSYIS